MQTEASSKVIAESRAQGASHGARADSDVTTIVTRRTVAAAPERVWSSLMFYEQIDTPPPLLLRLVLPRPIVTKAKKTAVGDHTQCLYEGGQLLKRVLRIDPGKYYEFAVVQQQLDFGGNLQLAGGSYSLRPMDRGATEIAVVTRYTGGRRPRMLWGPIEALVCHRFHHHLMRSIAGKAAAA
jgi:hypothetical protein